MQRVRIGIIGLASVFLLTILATAIYSLLGEGSLTSPPPANSVAANAAAAAAADAPREPLAELGVTPGNVPPAAAGPAATRPAPRPQH